jgi:hypothetical protein
MPREGGGHASLDSSWWRGSRGEGTGSKEGERGLARESVAGRSPEVNCPATVLQRVLKL